MSDSLKLSPAAADALLAELATLTTEAVSEDRSDLDTLGTAELAALMNEQDHGVAPAVKRSLPQIVAAIDDIVVRMAAGGRLVYVGAGTPGRLGIVDASECPPTFSTDPAQVVGVIAGGDRAIREAVEDAEDDPAGGARDVAALEITAADCVVGVSASGRTPYVVGALDAARARGALTIAVACNTGSAIGRVSDHAIEVVVGPEVIAGSTRLKAGTAQKQVLNMLSTITMVRLGKTYGNIMVDLHATNEKLRARAERAVVLVSGCSEEEAASALASAGGSVASAILMLLRGLRPDEARARLLAVPSLRAALDGDTV